MSNSKRKKPTSKTQRKHKTPANGPAKETTRRDMLRNIAIYGAIAGVVLAGGGVLVRGMIATAAESNLDVIGKGTPVVVQIHDPNCPDCNRLQREARAAMGGFSEDELIYRVANLTTANGASFAAGHGHGRVTLILLNAQGRRVQVISGVHDRQTLAQDFALLAADR